MRREVKAEVTRVCHTFGEGEMTVLILSARELGGEYLKVKVRDPKQEIRPGGTYVFVGQFGTTKWGEQFNASSFMASVPRDRNAVIRYLSRVDGMGPATAKQAWDTFGSTCIDIIREQPDVAYCNIRHLTEERAYQASKVLNEAHALEEVFLAVFSLLDGRGFGAQVIGDVIERWGASAIRIIKENPYSLMDFKGVSFLKADRLYIEMGLDPDADIRKIMCLWHAAGNGEGDTWRRLESCVTEAKESLTSWNDDKHLSLVIGSGRISVRVDEKGDRWITRSERDAQEKAIASQLASFMATDNQWPDMEDDPHLTEHQKEQLSIAFSSPVGCLVGTPGTGKTTAMARAVRMVAGVYGASSVAVACPTGKAAIRATEAMAAHGLSIQATTAHSLVGARGDDHEQITNSLDCKFLFLDEWPMGSTQVTSWIFNACERGVHILLVGDIGQLRSVGHGQPLIDMIEGGVPCGQLTEIKRNWGRIVQVCADMQAGKPLKFSPKMDRAEGENIILIEASSPTKQRSEMLRIVDKISKGDEFDPKWHIQVLCALNGGTPLSREELNPLLQKRLNPDGEGCRGNPFQTGDKAISLKNQWMPSIDDNPSVELRDGRAYVANGEMGEVIDVAPNWFAVELTAPYRMVRVPRGKGGCEWDLAYAISTHKSQGSEWPIVIVLLDQDHRASFVANRNWGYTAFSRATEACIVIGTKSTLKDLCLRRETRKTFLSEEISSALSVV